MFESFFNLVREIYPTEAVIALHEPRFLGQEMFFLEQAINSSFVSSVGPFVDQFEAAIADYCGSQYAIATVNGTAALHIALLLAGVKPGEEVITQAVSFVATSNAIHYCGAEPIFLDIDADSLGLSAQAISAFFAEFTERRENGVWNKLSGKRIAACLPMHTLGHPCDMRAILAVCDDYGINVIEDAAEALGSFRFHKHCGSSGLCGVLSFNGNKIMTTGGGGMILTNDAALAKQAKHLTTTAKQAHPWRFVHDQVAYNYRMPNLNAALGLAQLAQMPVFLQRKRLLAERYIDWAKQQGVAVVQEPGDSRANYWLNALVLENRQQRDDMLSASHASGIMTRPLWELLSELPMYVHCQTDELRNSRYFVERLLNIPSSVTI